MKGWIKTLVLALIIGFLAKCIEPFDPPRGSFDNLLVVEGQLHDGTDVNTVKISRTTPLDTVYFLPESGAQVQIKDDDGNITTLYETEPGIYQTTMNQFQGVIGKSYQLYIKTRVGVEIQSNEVLFKKTPEIDSVHWNLKSVKNEFGDQVDGLELYVSSHDPEANTRYYRWDWQETWEFTSRFASLWEYENGNVINRSEQINHCWRSNNSTNINIATSTNLTEDFINSQKLHYVTTETDYLRIQYSFLVKQYAIAESAFLYWQQLKDINESVGSLFDPQPSTVNGNLINLSNPAEPVLGYFDAASVTEKRIFILRNSLPDDWRIPGGFEYCRRDTVALADIEDKLEGAYYILDEYRTDFGILIGYTFGTPSCSDCRFLGTNIKPPYWQ